tara:strand:- start:44608 stop:44826 length:219 start_codon:yes stop_codon:yes gene_type:complete
MVTFPHGLNEQERSFLTRQAQLRDRLRWLDPRSARAKALRKELHDITRTELAREITPTDRTPKQPKTPWWQE